ncbi:MULTISPECIES: helix-turn-helix domain-containing protein [unclassified Sphingobium]|uniref:helix-turn-helix domain-containing protein n=1 Tax=unclassified Sphingobium TaxID=2611147 RepID=UPI0007700CF8|nr:helix-turn-helix transcriptional regulator [Sphingobium sp. TKS]AMK25082.1 DNA-binding protein [Sphingobium sp. TKS]NML90806.1 helix-turn-helix transcriptional regulator [Sphingobium sp. TB-6]
MLCAFSLEVPAVTPSEGWTAAYGVRTQKGWTQEQLAFEADVKRSYISEIESGKRNPSLDVVEKIAKALDVKLGLLME